MTAVQEEYMLSTLQEISVISTKNGCRISVVKDFVDGTQYIRKQFDEVYGLNVYKALLGVTHTNLPQILYVGKLNDGFVVMEEFVHGATLKTALISGTMPAGKVGDIALQVCNALEVLHGKTPPIIHRDINPSNIMVTAGGTVKLIDFDAAKEYKPMATSDTIALGTKAYAAPEQYGYAKTDARTDVYCLGATMYHMYVGAVYTAGSQFPKDKMGRVIQKCMQIDPANRYGNASAMKADLKAAAAGRNPSAKNPLFADLAGAPPWRKAVLIPLYVILTLLLAVAVYAFFVEVRGSSVFVAMRQISLLIFVFIVPYLLICNIFGMRNNLPLFRRKDAAGIVVGSIVVAILITLIAILVRGGFAG